MTLTHLIALDANDRQETLFRQHAGWARFAWNWGVAEARRALAAGEKSATSAYRLRPLFNRLKRDLAPWSVTLSQNAAKYALADLGVAWNCFWQHCREAREAGRKVPRRIRPPRFHSRKRGMSFRAANGPDTVRCSQTTIHLPRIGTVRTREACRFEGPVRECTVKHDGIRWQAAVVCEMADPAPKAAGGVSGVDVGLRRLATVHHGESAETLANPRPLKRALTKLRRINRRIARSRTIHGTNRGSNRRSRRYEERRRLYRRVKNLRLDVMHKATTAIAKGSRLVCIEALNVAGWMRNRRLSRATADASPSRFLSLLKMEVPTRGCPTRGGRPILPVEQDVFGLWRHQRAPPLRGDVGLPNVWGKTPAR